MLRLSVLCGVLLSALPISHAQITATLSPATDAYRIGNAITIRMQVPSPMGDRAWVGLFPAEVAHGANSGYLAYQYTGRETTFEMQFAAPNEPGQYEFRLLDADPGRELKAIPFTVAGIDPREISLRLTDEEGDRRNDRADDCSHWSPPVAKRRMAGARE